MPAMTRAMRTMARPTRALTIAALPRSIWWGLPAADMYRKAPHMTKKAADSHTDAGADVDQVVEERVDLVHVRLALAVGCARLRLF